MFRRLFVVNVEFPALDRLLDYLEAAEQKEIDALTLQAEQLLTRLEQSRKTLQNFISKENSLNG